MYEGEKTASLKGMLFLILYNSIGLCILFIIGIVAISVITYRRIQTVNSPNRKEITKEKKSKIERISFSIFILSMLIPIIYPKIILTLMFISTASVFILVNSIVYTATDDYYIDLIPPGPINTE